jgi:hypothetical protein
METQQEIWKAVAECNGEYYISSQGKFKSYKFGRERILKHGYDKDGYAVVGICRNGKSKNYFVHRLVALAFISNTENKPEVNHIDGDKLNNHSSNLEWNTSKENIKHAWDSGLFESKRLAIIKFNSKPVLDILTKKKYDSLKLACLDISESYNKHALRHRKSSKLQRFFYL